MRAYPLSDAVTESPPDTYQPGTYRLRRARLEGIDLANLANPATAAMETRRTEEGLSIVPSKAPKVPQISRKLRGM
jgi:hypothetical protein